MGREERDYWEAQLSEYWDSGLTIQEYSEQKELPYESTRRWSECCKRHARMERTTRQRWSWSRSILCRQKRGMAQGFGW